MSPGTAQKPDEKCLKKTNLLVYKGPTGERSDRNIPGNLEKRKFKIPICASKAKQIRVCTGAEMKKMCPPKICKCEPVKASGGGRGGLMSLLGFGIKAALAAAAWYVTYDMGIWGSSEDTHQLYKSYCKMMMPPRDEKTGKWEPVQCKAEKQMMKIPRFDPYAYCDNPPVNLQRQAYNLQNNWNRTVSFIFSGIAGLPFNIIDKFKGNSVEKNLSEEEQQSCVLYSDLPEEEREEIITNAYKK